MLDRKLWWTGAAVTLTAVFAVLLSNMPGGEKSLPIQEPVVGIRMESSQEENSAGAEFAYLLKEYQGRIAVFIPGQDEPQMIFDVPVKFLPDYDRVQMETGIPVEDYEALSAIIEDYIS